MCSAEHADCGRLPVAATTNRRESRRNVTVFKVVKINRDGIEGFARCRNISESGLRLESTMPLGVDDELIVELVPGEALHARVVWTNGKECGLAVEGSIDLDHVLAKTSEEKRQLRSRSARLNTAISARIATNGCVLPTTISNISQRGMLVSHDGSLTPGLELKVLLSNGKEREALVQWVHGRFAGLFLIEPFSVMELGDVTSLG